MGTKPGTTWRRWTVDEEEFIKKNYLIMSYPEIAKQFGTTKDSVRAKARKLGLFHTKEQFSKKYNKGERRPGYDRLQDTLISAFNKLMSYYPEKRYEAINYLRTLADCNTNTRTHD